MFSPHLFLILMFLGRSPASVQNLPPPRDAGVLLLAEEGDRRWNLSLAEIKKRLGGKAPVEVVIGRLTAKELQRSVDRLARRSVGKIVAVPLYLFSNTDDLEQMRYALGLREQPSASLLQRMGSKGRVASLSLARVETKLPISMTPALEDHSLMADILASHAKKISRRPQREILILASRAGGSEEENARRSAVLSRLAPGLQKAAGFKEVQAWVIDDAGDRKSWQQESLQFREKIVRLGRGSDVLMIAYALPGSGLERSIKKALEGCFYRLDAVPLAPHPNFADWAAQSVESGKRLPDQRRYVQPYRPSAPE
ncbi:MAG: hypothetical protein HY611_03365 [Elusimicrobia bacterium]|nr:hypothetical protein [Elusimicrobiota bacterium]